MTTQSIQKLENKVKAMCGKTFLVNTLPHKVMHFQIHDMKLTIVSDRKFFPAVDIAHADRFLEQFLETEESLPAVVVPEKPASLQSAGEIKEILMENIRKVKEDKNYIPQAAEIANQVDKLFTMAKLEIQYLGLMKNKGNEG